MNYLERYLSGEHERVWNDLQNLGAAVRKEPHYSLARRVAAETMRRVRRDCELIISRLRSAGYVFGLYPDGTHGYYTEGPLVTPSDSTHSDGARLEARVGPLPLSLEAFWQEVGSIDLVGMHPSWPTRLDPLVVCPPKVAILDLDSWEAEDEEYKPKQFEASLAPDLLHKDNTSGGPPYGVALPNSSVEFVLLNELHGLLFVPYLRLAIFQLGGFPGLGQRSERFELLDELVAGLEPF